MPIGSASRHILGIGAASGAIAAIGVLTLIGWAADIQVLTAWIPGTPPMAPVTGVLSVLFGAAVFLADIRSTDVWLIRAAIVCETAGLAGSVAVLGIRLLGHSWSIERLGLQPSFAAANPAYGFASAITAWCFVWAHLTLLGIILPRPPAVARRWPAVSGTAIGATGFSWTLLAVFELVPGNAGIVPVAANTGVVIFMIGLALLALAVRPRKNWPVAPGRAWDSRAAYVAVYAGVAAAVITGSSAYYWTEEVGLRRQMQNELEVVSNLKLRELSRWRAERIDDAHSVLADATLLVTASRFVEGRDSSALRGRLVSSLSSHTASSGDYDRAYLIDARGATVFSTRPTMGPASDALSRQAVDTLRSGQVTLLDFFLDERDQPHLAVLIPVAEGSTHRPLAVIALQVDPEKFVYPFLTNWPGSRRSPETLLVRRDGNDVLFLNPLKFDAGAAMHRRVPISASKVLAVQAVLGHRGYLEGVDYRGVDAISVVQAVPASPWFLVTRIDHGELNADLFARLWTVVAFTTMLLTVIGAGLALVWRDQQARSGRAQVALSDALRESEERLRLALNAANQGTYDLNVQTGEAVVSPEYASMLGYDPATFHETNDAWIDRLHPEDRASTVAAYSDYIAGRTADYRVEFRQRRRTGDWQWVLSIGRVVSRTPDGRPLRMLGTHTDITQRKLAEVRTQRLSRYYAALSECNEAIVRCVNETELFPKVCEAAVTHGGMAMAWVGLTDPVTGLVTPVASFGFGTDYLTGIQISTDADSPFGRGPTGTAVRENRACWIDDFRQSANTEPWHGRAEPFGWRASVGLPLTRNGQPVGSLTIYTFDAHAFDDDSRRLLIQMAADISFAMDTFARNAERMASAEALLRSVREKEALLREVHHRVKNNMQIITSMVRLESGRSGHAAVKAVLGEMKNRILSMALLHETLYRSGDLATVDLSAYLAQLANQLLRTLPPAPGRITLRLDLAPVATSPDDAIPCGLIVNELMCNAIKHAFPDGRSGEIAVSLQCVAGGPELRLSVSDNGVGLPPDFQERSAQSLGLHLVSDLARQLRGTVSITGSADGACVAICFALGTSNQPARNAGRAPDRAAAEAI